MVSALARALADDGLVAPAALNEALQRQVVFGGSLDTNLLEIGAVGESTLLEGLAKHLGLAAAGREQIDQIGEHLSRLFPLVFAETYRLVPFRIVEQDLWVLVNGVPDDELFARIRERLRLAVRPIVTTEVRLHYAMHRLYGTVLQPRFASLLKKLDGALLASARATTDHVLSWGLARPAAPPAARDERRRRTLEVRALLRRLDDAPDRDSIVDVLLETALAVFDFAGLFAVHGDVVNGWRGPDLEGTERLARVSLNVELPSVFQTIYATGGHYLGPLPQNSINAKLLADMGRPAPRAALLAPISVSGRLAAILYADNGARGVSSKRVAAVLLLAQRAGMAFERLIRRRKSKADPTRGTLVADESRISGPMTISPEGESWVVTEAASIPEAAAADVAEARSLSPAEEAPGSIPTPTTPVPAAPVSGAALAPVEEAGRESVGSAGLGESVELEALEPLEPLEIAEDEIVLEPEETEPAAPPPSRADDTYTAFADVSDSPSAALDDWEDVLVETVGGEGADGLRASRRPAKAAPPSVTWEDVIAEAERAHLVPVPSVPIEVAGTMVDERELLLDTVEAQDPEARRGAVAKLLVMGASVDDELRIRFPGRLGFDPLAPNSGLPPFRACSGICELLAARGASAAAVVLPHLESPDPVRRLFAIYYLHTVVYPPAMGALARRLYDTEPRNRYLAAEALRAYAQEPGYSLVTQDLRDQLKVPVLESQVAAVQVLGQLREPMAVPSLIPLVIAKRAELAGAAASALAVICGQAFGADVAGWAEWWQSHYNRPRAAWLVESLRHPSPALVRLAHHELVLLAGRDLPLDPEAPASVREAQIRQWEAWWQQVARELGSPAA